MVWTLSGVEGVPAGHIVHFILDAVEQLPITDFRVNERGSGSEQYPPRMMLALAWSLVPSTLTVPRRARPNTASPLLANPSSPQRGGFSA